jgi:short-subunit dehydrogenase
MRKTPHCILITGASSGIGKALAIQMAGPGIILGLLARRLELLKEVAQVCESFGAQVQLGEIDVRDASGLNQWVQSFDARFPIDWVFANAGISYSIGPDRSLESPEKVDSLLTVNLQGLINTVYAALPHLRKRGSGQIGLMSSLAAWRGMALTPAYSASKAGVKAYGEALRDLLAGEGIGVSIICPGFVETSMSQSFPGEHPGMIPSETAAVKIIAGMHKNHPYIAFPFHFFMGLRLLGLLPFGLGSWFLRHLSLQPK